MIPIKLAIPVLLLTLVQACKHSCEPNYVNPAFIGFAPGDLDSFVIRAYQPNSNYVNPVDTLLIAGGAAVITASNDTVIAYINVDPSLRPLHSGYDWQIYLPKKNRIITLTNIEDLQREGHGKLCYDGISSFKLNGQLVVPQVVNTGTWYTSGYFVYITNN